MKNAVLQPLRETIRRLVDAGILPGEALDNVVVKRTRDATHGDFASNIAMRYAGSLGCPPRELAQKIIDSLISSPMIERAEVAGPGFINFHFTASAYHSLVNDIRHAGQQYGYSEAGHGESVLVEFVSTNPTGPLHVGHGRGAAYGDALCRVLRATGYTVHSEYYINDAGRQMDILAISVWMRYLQGCGESVVLAQNAYQGHYVVDLADGLKARYGTRFVVHDSALFCGLGDTAETAMDETVARCKKALGDDEYRIIFDYACAAMVEDIRLDLAEFGVEFGRWFSERSLVDNGDIDAAVKRLDENGHLYEQDGAKWFRATAFGDAKDRVVVRANGVKTYFASDIAYHFNKAERGFDRIINIFGADHHGYIKRIAASFEALGNLPQRLKFLIVQFAVLYRGHEKVSMSTRSGDFVTLRDLRNEVGNDACRFFYVMRKSDQHMEFDLELAKSQSAENPVYYIQYAHARICSVFRQLADKNLPTLDAADPDYALLGEAQEAALLRTLSRFPEVVEMAATNFEPHHVAYYLRGIANEFHGYYNAHPFLSADGDIRLARLGLIDAVRIVIHNGLSLLGVQAPRQM